MNLKPYPEYKDSGVPWLGEVPKVWGIHKTKYLFNERVEKGFPNEPLLAATQTKGVVPKSHYETRTVTAQKDFHLLKLVKQNDFVISLRSFQGGIELAYYQGIISPAYTIMIPFGNVLTGYFKYLAKSKPFIKLLTTCVTGIREGQNIDYEILKRNKLPLPPLPEQTQIARFLDWKTSQIARFIKVKKRMIELLKEQKQVVINDAVTGKIDVTTGKPYPKYKDSGVEWLGLVPEGWEVRRNIHLFQERNENGIEGLPILVVSLNTGVTIGNDIDDDGRPRKIIEDRSVYKLAKENDISYNMMRMWQGAVGVIPVNGLVSPAYVVATPLFGVLSKYYIFLFRTKNYLNEINRNSRGIVTDRNRLYWDDFKNIFSPVPSHGTQMQIVEYIVTKLTAIDLAISRIEREITLIQEYRDRLIADVVTGKVDVREIEVPEVADESSEMLDDSNDMEYEEKDGIEEDSENQI